jgi:hypothetical protein
MDVERAKKELIGGNLAFYLWSNSRPIEEFCRAYWQVIDTKLKIQVSPKCGETDLNYQTGKAIGIKYCLTLFLSDLGFPSTEVLIDILALTKPKHLN